MQIDSFHWVRNKRVTGAFAIATAFVTTSLLLGGCGAGGSGAAHSVASPVAIGFSFSRAAASAKLPNNALSVKLTVRDSKSFQDFRVLNRPQDTNISEVVAEFFALSPGSASLNVVAYSGANASGEPLAEAGLNTNLSISSANRPDIVFNPLYSHVVLARAGGSVGTSETILQDGTLTLSAAGKTDGNVTSVDNLAGTWTSSNPQIVSVNANGLVTGLLPGTSVVTFADTATPPRTATVTVVVKGGNVEVPVQ